MKIRPATANDFQDMLDICNARLGKNYLDLNNFQSFIEDPTATLLVSSEAGIVTGVILTYLRKFCDLIDLIGKAAGELSIRNEQPVSLLKTIAVQEGQTGRGMGLALLNRWMEKQAAETTLISLNWQNRSTSLNKLIERLGFIPTTRITEYWKNESLEKGYLCPECGAPPCRCSAVFYVRPGIN